MTTPNYYQILHINRLSDETAIKTAYKNLSLKYHPDRIAHNFPNATDAEKEHYAQLYLDIQMAAGTLSHPQIKEQYDQQLDKFLTSSRQVHDVLYFGQCDVIMGYNPDKQDNNQDNIQNDESGEGDEDVSSKVGIRCPRCTVPISVDLDEVLGSGDKDNDDGDREAFIIQCESCSLRYQLDMTDE